VVTFGEHRHDGSMRSLLGPEPDDTLRQALSLETRVSENTPPAFIWHTADDGAVPVENVLLLTDAMKRQGVPFALHIFEHGRHGLGLAGKENPAVARWTKLAADWLTQLGFIEEI
jgi:acetyl esterase/lipase